MGGGATQHLSQPEGTDTLLMPLPLKLSSVALQYMTQLSEIKRALSHLTFSSVRVK
jgi:hypothetical protein